MMTKWRYYCLIVLCGCLPLTALAERFWGTVRDAQSNVPLPQVEIKDLYGKVLAHTDEEGLFSVEVSAKKLEIVAFLQGYAQKKVVLAAEKQQDLRLSPLSTSLKTLTVTAVRERRGNNAFTYSVNDVRGIANLTGELDVMRYMQVMPGVSQGMEGGMGFYVRGAGNGNNRVELDGVTISAPTHLFGLFSTFQADIVDKLTFQMGGISAASGDLTSSLLKIETPKPSMDKYKTSFSLSPLMAGASVQGYVVKNKLSFHVAGRSSLLYPEFLLLKTIIGKDNISGSFEPQVQDGYAKLYWQVNRKHAVEMMLYGSHDYLDYQPEYIDKYAQVYGSKMRWDNSLSKLQWNFNPSPQTRLVTTAYLSGFSSLQEGREVTPTGLGQGAAVGSVKNERGVRSQLFTQLGKIALNGGVDLRNQLFRPALQTTFLDAKRSRAKDVNYTTSQTSLFTEAEYKDERYKLKGGLRYTLYKDAAEQSSHYLDVRLHSSTFLTKNAGVEVTFDRLSQFQHSLEGLPVGWALDLVVPASQTLRPELSHQFYAGGFWGNDTYYATLGAYYRNLSNVVRYKSLLNLFVVQNVSWKQDVTQGEGRSYGLELWLEKRKGRWTGSFAYTLSRTTRQFELVNDGEAFPFKLDRTHNLNLQAQCLVKANEHSEQRFNTSVYFSSGNNMTVPQSTYIAEDLPYWNTETGAIYGNLYHYHAQTRTQMSKVNAYRLDNYLRVDVGYSLMWKHRKWNHELTFSVYNLLMRNNPYLVFHEDEKWKQLSLLSLVPSIRWEVHF